MKKVYIFVFLLCCVSSFAVTRTISTSIYSTASSGVNTLPSTNIPTNSRKVRIINRLDSMPEIETALTAAEYIFTDALAQEQIDLVEVDAELLFGNVSDFAYGEICKVEVEYSDTIFYNSQYHIFSSLDSPFQVLYPKAMTNQTRGNAVGVGMHLYLNPSLSYHLDTTPAPEGKFDMITILLRALVVGCGVQSSLTLDSSGFGIIDNGNTYVTAFDTQIYNDDDKTFSDVVAQNVSDTNFLAYHSVFADGYNANWDRIHVQLVNEWEIGVQPFPFSAYTLNTIDYNTYTDDELADGFYDLLDVGIREGVSIRSVTPYSMALLRKLGWLKDVAVGEGGLMNYIYNSTLHCNSKILQPSLTYTLSMSGGAEMSHAECKIFSNDSSYVLSNVSTNNEFSYQSNSISPYIQWQRNPVTKNIVGQFQADAGLFIDNQYISQKKTYDIEIPFAPNRPIVNKSESTDNGYIQLNLNAFANGSNTYTVTYTGVTYSDNHTFTVAANALDTVLTNIPANQVYNISIYGSNSQGNSSTIYTSFGFSAHPTLNMTIIFNNNYISYDLSNNGTIDISDVVISSVQISDALGNVYITCNAGSQELINISSLPRGRYLITVVADGNAYSRMFLKR